MGTAWKQLFLYRCTTPAVKDDEAFTAASGFVSTVQSRGSKDATVSLPPMTRASKSATHQQPSGKSLPPLADGCKVQSLDGSRSGQQSLSKARSGCSCTKPAVKGDDWACDDSSAPQTGTEALKGALPPLADGVTINIVQQQKVNKAKAPAGSQSAPVSSAKGASPPMADALANSKTGAVLTSAPLTTANVTRLNTGQQPQATAMRAKKSDAASLPPMSDELAARQQAKGPKGGARAAAPPAMPPMADCMRQAARLS